MSLETLDIYKQHKIEEVENGPFSETFTIFGGATFKGVFDHSHIEETSDSGNVTQKKRYARIIVSERPESIDEDVQITRENGDSYKFKRDGKDDMGMVLLWLY